MLVAIARKELREVLRDRVIVAVLGVFVATLIGSCFACHQAWAEQEARQTSLHDDAREAWLSQSTSSAHQATHDGQTVYKRSTRLAAIDPGTDPVLGTKVRLESHRRHEAAGVMRGDQLSFFRLSFETPALLVQAVLPLIAILLSYAIVAREREHGTWKLLLTLGVKYRSVILGKLLAVFALVVVLAAPILLTILWTVVTASGDTVLPFRDLAGRAVVLAAINLLYLFGWCATGVAISARFSSGASLVVLVASWAVLTLVVPRVAVDLAYSQHPLPDRTDREQRREAAIRHGSDGQRALKDFNANLERRLLKQYGVDNVGGLPIDIDAARLLAMEEFTDAIDDDDESKLAAVYEQQNALVDRFELGSPYLAIRSLSMAIAGTDRRHHEAFLTSAERYRRLYVKILNTAEMKREGPGDTAESARQFWGRIPAFQQATVTWPRLADSSKWPFGLLVVWSLTMVAIALRPAKEATT